MSDLRVSCTECGACCSAFRVSFHRSELAADGRPGVPANMAVHEVGNTWRMVGTDDSAADGQPPRCVALCGTVGEAVSCSIYDQRPSPCREFGALASVGIYEAACNRARARHGLPRLKVEDSW